MILALGRLWRVLLLSLLLLPQLALAQNESDTEKEDWIYTIRPDDSLWALCKTYSKEPDCWLKLVKYNKLQTPKDIPPGTRIRIPQVWLKDTSATAEAIAVEGEVHKLEVHSQARSPLSIGDKLAQNDQVRSLEGNATLEFADGSQLYLKSNTLIHLETLSYNDADDITNTRVRLDRGRLRNLIKSQKAAQSSYEIATPAAIAAVRGTDFRVTMTNDSPPAMLTEVTEGVVAVANGDQEFILEKGFAIRAVAGEPMQAPVALLSRPSVKSEDEQSLTLPEGFSWEPLKDAVAYRITVYQGARVVQESRVEKPEVALNNLPIGEFELYIRGID